MTGSPIIPVVLSGGAGVRLWPLSRAAKPKQFLKIGGEHSLIQQTLLRCSDPIFDQRPIIVSSESQRFLVAEDLRAINVDGEIVLEPMRRDSCAAVAAGCLIALKRAPDAMVLVLAADHRIDEINKFAAAIAQAQVDAQEGYLTTFGVRPTCAATGYGYIKPGEFLRLNGCQKIERFVEKPNAEMAEHYMREGYLWNSGNFLFLAARFIEELKIHAPTILEAVDASVENAAKDSDFIRLNAADFAGSPLKSVDYAVMEKTKQAAVYSVDYRWNDIGSWDAVHDVLDHDEFDNAIEGRGVVFDGRNNLVHSVDRVTVLSGIDNVIVVSTADVVYVGRRGQSEKMKALVNELKAQNFSEIE
jgi:mannose-1-phosphate guanylyltransferase / mannose-6-phosphate isomerase